MQHLQLTDKVDLHRKIIDKCTRDNWIIGTQREDRK